MPTASVLKAVTKHGWSRLITGGDNFHVIVIQSDEREMFSCCCIAVGMMCTLCVRQCRVWSVSNVFLGIIDTLDI